MQTDSITMKTLTFQTVGMRTNLSSLSIMNKEHVGFEFWNQMKFNELESFSKGGELKGHRSPRRKFKISRSKSSLASTTIPQVAENDQ